MALGHGAHYCIGAPLARQEARIALQSFFQEHPDRRQDDNVALDYALNRNVCMLRALPVVT